MTGWSLAESLGKPVRDLFALCDAQSQEPVENPVQRTLREQQASKESMRLMITIAQRRPAARVLHAPRRFAAARTAIDGVVMVFRDETERLRTEWALRNADQRKDEFLATLAHELRNPLAPISMGLELMKVSADDPETHGRGPLDDGAADAAHGPLDRRSARRVADHARQARVAAVAR